MTLNLELAPELEEKIAQQAQQQGQSVAEYVTAMLREKTEAPAKPRRELKGYGMFAHLGPRVDDFLAERREEAETEMRQAEERDKLRRERHEGA